jgi:hypothetical protein
VSCSLKKHYELNAPEITLSLDKIYNNNGEFSTTYLGSGFAALKPNWVVPVTARPTRPEK